MDTDVISAAPEFRRAILALLTETDWLARYGPIIVPEFFPTKDEQAFVKWTNDYYKKYGVPPSYVALGQGLGTDGELLSNVAAVNDADITYAADVALDFAQVQAMKVAIIQSVDDIQKGDLHKPLERVKQAQEIGADRSDLGMELLADVDKWVGEELHGRRYPTGWTKVDNILGGGLAGGEFGMVMAPQGMGKTSMLVNVGYGLAGLMGAVNVLHVTLEVSVEQVLARYAARVAGVRLNREEDAMSEQQFKSTLAKTAKQRLRGRLRAVYGKWTVADIKATIDNLAARENFRTGALIVDYPDLMTASRHREEKRFELADICRELRQLGNDYMIPIWGASQSSRESFYKETIETASIAEAIEKAAVVDVLITLCQTREEEKLDQGRLFMAKVRRSKSHSFVPVKINFEHQSIVVRSANVKAA